MSGYLSGLWSALLGRETGATAAGSEDEVGLRARVASLQMDLRERDAQIASLQSEHEAQRADRDRAVASSAEERLEKVLKRVAPALSSASALRAMVEQGKEVAPADILASVRDVERELARAGLVIVGAPGERAVFDPAVHQRMSGGDVRPGSDVVVRLPGYKLGDRVLLKAMVSAGEEA
jgi:molecular chaperone GrpE (heat shock protein)